MCYANTNGMPMCWLCTSPQASALLPMLCLCRDMDRAQEAWFADTDAVRAAVGLQDEAPPPQGTEVCRLAAHASLADSRAEPLACHWTRPAGHVPDLL